MPLNGAKAERVCDSVVGCGRRLFLLSLRPKGGQKGRAGEGSAGQGRAGHRRQGSPGQDLESPNNTEKAHAKHAEHLQAVDQKFQGFNADIIAAVHELGAGT